MICISKRGFGTPRSNLHVDGHHLRSGQKVWVLEQTAPLAYQFATENILLSSRTQGVARSQDAIRLSLLTSISRCVFAKAVN